MGLPKGPRPRLDQWQEKEAAKGSAQANSIALSLRALLSFVAQAHRSALLAEDNAQAISSRVSLMLRAFLLFGE